MVKRIFMAVLAGMCVLLMVLPSGASLMPMSWGFPSFSQDSSLDVFEKEIATASDVESASIAFPTSGCSAFGSSFPTIAQTADQNQLLSSIRSMNQRETQSFAYPFLSIGYSQIPSMGFL